MHCCTPHHQNNRTRHGQYLPTLIRMNPDGSLDTSFGEDGIASGELDPSFGEDGTAYIDADAYYLKNIKQQADGKVVVIGQMWNQETNQPDFSVSRLLYEDANAVNESETAQNVISLFPNPANEILNVKWRDNSISRFAISR